MYLRSSVFRGSQPSEGRLKTATTFQSLPNPVGSNLPRLALEILVEPSSVCPGFLKDLFDLSQVSGQEASLQAFYKSKSEQLKEIA